MAGATVDVLGLKASELQDNLGAWYDVTGDLKQKAMELPIGALVHDRNFTLHDAMTAIELMDPKMDSGMDAAQSTVAIKSLAEAIQKGLKLEGFTATEVVGIMDELITNFALYLRGNSLAQTLFSCLYLHDPSLVKHTVLQAFCYGMLKTAYAARQIIYRAQAYHEEDFNPMTYLFPFCEERTPAWLREQLTSAREEIVVSLEALKGKDMSDEARSAEDALLNAMLDRLQLIGALYDTLELSDDVARAAKAQKSLANAKRHLLAAKASIALGAQDLAWEPKPFQPHMNAHLLAPTPPRDIEKLTRHEGCAFFETEFGHLHTALSITTLSTLREFFDFFEGMARKHPGVLSRSRAFTLFMPSQDVLGKFSFRDLIVQDMIEFNHPPELDPSLKEAAPRVVDMLEAFIAQCAVVFAESCKIWCYNRARQRRKIAKFLVEFQTLESEGAELDYEFSMFVGQGNPQVRDLSVGSYVLRYTTDFCIKFLLLGLELDLYARYELHSVFFYTYTLTTWIKALSESGFKQKLALHEEEQSVAAAAAAAKAKGKGKGKAPAPAAPKTPRPMPSFTWRYYEAVSCLTHGYHRVLDAFRLDGRLNATMPEFARQEINYAHRFKPFAEMTNPPYIPYVAYRKQTDLISVLGDQLAPKPLYNAAVQQFENARTLFERLLTSPNPPTGETKADVEALLTVAKTNHVVAKLALMGFQADNKPQVLLDYSTHATFPIFKLKP